MNKFKFDTITESEIQNIERLANVVRSSELYNKYAKCFGEIATRLPVQLDYRNGRVKFKLTDFAYKVTDGCIKKDVIKLMQDAYNDAVMVIGHLDIITSVFDGFLSFGIRNHHTPRTQAVPQKCGAWLKPASEKVIRLASVLAELFRLVDYNTFGITFTQKDASGNVVKTSYEYGVNVPQRHTKSLDFVVFREASRILANITDDGCDFEPFSPDHATIKATDTGDVYEIDF